MGEQNTENKDVESAAAPPRYFLARVCLSMALLWFSFPPIGVSSLGWIALVPLAHLIMSSQKLGIGSMAKVWFAGFLYWLATFYFIPIPHPLLWFGWLAVSLYLACYLPLMFVAAHTMIHRFRIHAVFSIPMTWVGIEFMRSNLLTGMALVCLSHTQYEQPLLIQVSDLSGAYTLSFALAVFSTSIASFLLSQFSSGRSARASIALAPATVVVLLVGGYGWYQLRTPAPETERPLVVGLIQGSIDTVFPQTQEEAREIFERKTNQYIELTAEALNKWDDLDLVIWPENGWPARDLLPDTQVNQLPYEQLRYYQDAHGYVLTRLHGYGQPLPPMLVGAVSEDPIENRVYGSALFVDNEGRIADRYLKNHLVMFGEYVPLAEWIPALQEIPAIGTGIQAGTESIVVTVNEKKLAPSICFESTVPHYIRRQINTLAEQGDEPDCMINLTNDGWFYGTSCLDFHLACNVFRAVEMRKPHVVCANTGLSAVIDAQGRILQQGPRQATKTLRGEIHSSSQHSPYRVIGDWIPFLFAILTAIFASFALVLPRRDPLSKPGP